MKKVVIIGAGLAGSEAAWQCARRGVEVELWEMRPVRRTPAHETGDFAELVCSNSLKSESENTAPWLLKEEMRRAGSLLLEIARECAVPAGHALAVDREKFAKSVTEAIAREPLITVRREECIAIAEDTVTIVASGPLTSEGLSAEIARLCAGNQDLEPQSARRTAAENGTSEEEVPSRKGLASSNELSRHFRAGLIPAAPEGLESGTREDAGNPPDWAQTDKPESGKTAAESGENGDPERREFHEASAQAGIAAPQHHLYFYDSISPIVEADSIDMSRVYLAARYDKGTADYINCPFTKEEYDRFYDGLIAAQAVEERDWEKLNYFEGCLPIEEIARRGRDTLRFGPMKPVGLRDPRTGKQAYAVVQLRQENLRADSYNLVGFQNHLKYGEQARVLRLIPGLENAKFLRYGQIHRNTYINAPALLTSTLQMKRHPQVLFAGQICGVEGYVESMATGLLAGLHATAMVESRKPAGPPRATALGSLVHYITQADPRKFQPANITFDLLPPWETKIRDKKERHRLQCERALAEIAEWIECGFRL